MSRLLCNITLLMWYAFLEIKQGEEICESLICIRLRNRSHPSEQAGTANEIITNQCVLVPYTTVQCIRISACLCHYTTVQCIRISGCLCPTQQYSASESVGACAVHNSTVHPNNRITTNAAWHCSYCQYGAYDVTDKRSNVPTISVMKPGS